MTEQSTDDFWSMLDDGQKYNKKMRNYELLKEIYKMCREEGENLNRFPGRYVRQSTVVHIEQLLQQERPELKNEVQ